MLSGLQPRGLGGVSTMPSLLFAPTNE